MRENTDKKKLRNRKIFLQCALYIHIEIFQNFPGICLSQSTGFRPSAWLKRDSPTGALLGTLLKCPKQWLLRTPLSDFRCTFSKKNQLVVLRVCWRNHCHKIEKLVTTFKFEYFLYLKPYIHSWILNISFPIEKFQKF